MADIPTEGSVDKPYRQNPPRMFQEVHWGGGFAVGVGIVNGVLLLHGSKTWAEAKTLSRERTNYNNRAGAFGNPVSRVDDDGNPISTPTFLLGGQATVTTDEFPGFLFVSWIEASTDGGKTWVSSYEANQSLVAAIVYDKTEQVFYAQVTAGDVGDGTYTWQVLRSPDGMSWGVVETAPALERYASPIMTAAADPIYQDAEGNNCPGGVYGYNKAKKILMAPYPDVIAYAHAGRFGSEQIQIRKEDDAGARTYSYVDIPGMDYVVSVAFSGGLWQAAGRDNAGDVARIATSADDGRTWVITYAPATPSGARIILGNA